MTSIFSLLLFLFVIVFVDASASSTASGGLRETDVDPHHDSMLHREFIEADYKAIMTNYRSDQGSLRGRKLEENNIDYQKPYYQSQEQHVSRGQAITLAIVVTLTVGLAAYSVFLYREYVASTIYNALGYRLFSGTDEQMTSGASDYEMS